VIIPLLGKKLKKKKQKSGERRLCGALSSPETDRGSSSYDALLRDLLFDRALLAAVEPRFNIRNARLSTPDGSIIAMSHLFFIDSLHLLPVIFDVLSSAGLGMMLSCGSSQLSRMGIALLYALSYDRQEQASFGGHHLYGCAGPEIAS
jgi:hypothetical protein